MSCDSIVHEVLVRKIPEANVFQQSSQILSVLVLSVTRSDRCITDIFSGDCGEGGACVKPDKCVCGYLYANSEDGGCYSLRGDGIKGAGCALVVIICAISICGGLQTYLTKKQKPE